MKKLLKQILKDRKKGLVLSHHQAMMVQSEWLKLFGTGGCYYPNRSESNMLKDLLEEYNIVQDENNN
jgi:hypothetical protein